MDIEWAKDGEDGKLYIVQARPKTVASCRAPVAFETYALKAICPISATCRAVGENSATITIFSATLQRRRRGFPVKTSTLRKPCPSNW
jgi:phosphoenolpyruvate synthase/pyruvate phosphate dikinase